MGIGDEIEKLHALKEQGILTEGEYSAQKQRLLTGQNRPAAFVRPYNSQQSYGAGGQEEADLSSRGRLQAKEILFSWEGRIPRVVYWSYGLLCLLFWGVGGVGGALVGGQDGVAVGVGLAALLTLWPIYAIACKRWHDRDMSGWWSLVGFVPYLGGIVSFIVCGCLRGTEGPNRFGPDDTHLY